MNKELGKIDIDKLTTLNVNTKSGVKKIKIFKNTQNLTK